ncbi:MAG: hypothetical protein ACRC8K_03370 [Waterburya sp.]
MPSRNFTSNQLLESILVSLDQLGGSVRNENSTQINLNLIAETWTDLALTSDASEFQVLSSDNVDVTDSFEYRIFQGKWQIFSLISQNNLQIILNP